MASEIYQPSDLVTARDRIATTVVDRQFSANPMLTDRYGEKGKRKCWEDARYHLLYLAEAVAAQSPTLFRNYATWLRELLEGLSIPRDDLLAQFNLLAAVLREQPDQSDSATAANYLEQIVRDPSCLMPPPVASFASAPDVDDIANPILEHLLRCDRTSAIRHVDDALLGGMPIETLYLQVFQPLLREVGYRWQTNRVSVAQEHYCTAAIQLMMGRLSDRIFMAESNGHTVVAACVGNELHEVGLRMVADLLQADGWDSHFLGANVPTRDLLATLEKTGADVLCLSATLTTHLAKTHEVIKAVRADPLLKHRVKVVVGGYPFNVDTALWRRLDADGHAMDAKSALLVCADLMERANA